MTPVLAAIAPLPLAHAGHWLGGVIYLAPVVAVAAVLGFSSWRDRRRHGDGGPGAD